MSLASYYKNRAILALHKKRGGVYISGFIPEHIVAEIKETNELVALVEQYVRLEKKSGSNFFGLCPFHQEKTASFSVSPSKQIYYCFGCHKGGDVVSFVMEIEKLSYLQALHLLAERSGVKLPEPDDENWRRRSEQKKQLETILLEAARYFYKNLTGPAGAPARNYLQQRAFKPAICTKFGLGFAPDNWSGLLQHLAGLGLTDEKLLLQSGLFRARKSGGLYDLFRHRLMFPIFDTMGRVIAFGGRVIDNSEPKYINSPETAVYIKGRHLYGLNLAKASRQDQLLIVEGYLDALALHQAGFDQTVAALGTALTTDQARLLSRYSESVVIAFDADAAGQAATLRSLDILEEQGLKVTVLTVPDAKDPDEYIRRHGPERFQALLDKALPLLEYKLLRARQSSLKDERLDPLAYQEEACRVLALEKNAIVREYYAKKLAEEIKIAPETVLIEIKKRLTEKDQPAARTRPSSQSENKAPQQAEKKTTFTREELYLLGLLASDLALAQPLGLTENDFSAGPLRTVARRVLDRPAEGRLEPSQLIELCGDLSVDGFYLHDLMARVLMRLDDVFGKQDRLPAAQEQLWRQRIFLLRNRIEDLTAQLEQPNEPEQYQQIRQELLQATRDLTGLKQKTSSQA